MNVRKAEVYIVLFLSILSIFMLIVGNSGLKYNSRSITTITTKTNIHLRSYPSLEADIMDIVKRGNKVEVIKEEGAFAKVKYHNKEGWISNSQKLVDIKRGNDHFSIAHDSFKYLLIFILGLLMFYNFVGYFHFDIAGIITLIILGVGLYTTGDLIGKFSSSSGIAATLGIFSEIHLGISFFVICLLFVTVLSKILFSIRPQSTNIGNTTFGIMSLAGFIAFFAVQPSEGFTVINFLFLSGSIILLIAVVLFNRRSFLSLPIVKSVPAKCNTHKWWRGKTFLIIPIYGCPWDIILTDIQQFINRKKINKERRTRYHQLLELYQDYEAFDDKNKQWLSKFWLKVNNSEKITKDQESQLIKHIEGDKAIRSKIDKERERFIAIQKTIETKGIFDEGISKKVDSILNRQKAPQRLTLKEERALQDLLREDEILRKQDQIAQQRYAEAKSLIENYEFFNQEVATQVGQILDPDTGTQRLSRKDLVTVKDLVNQDKREKAEDEKIQEELEQIHHYREVIQDGGATTALRDFIKNYKPASPRTSIEFLKLRCTYYQKWNIIDKEQAELKELLAQLRFNEENLEYYYRYGVIEQELGNANEALAVFQQFVDEFLVDYKDVQKRYNSLRDGRLFKTGAPQGSPARNGVLRVHEGLLEPHLETFEKTIQRFIDKEEYYLNSVLLNKSFREVQREANTHTPPAVDKVQLQTQLEQILKKQGFQQVWEVNKQALQLVDGDGYVQEHEWIICALQDEHYSELRIGIDLKYAGLNSVDLLLYKYYEPEFNSGQTVKDHNQEVLREVSRLKEGELEYDREIERLERMIEQATQEMMESQIEEF